MKLQYETGSFSLTYCAKSNQIWTFLIFSMYLEQLSPQIPLMVIAERFVESLVYMKRKLCWQTQDIIYLKLKSSSETKKKSSQDARYGFMYSRAKWQTKNSLSPNSATCINIVACQRSVVSRKPISRP